MRRRNNDEQPAYGDGLLKEMCIRGKGGRMPLITKIGMPLTAPKRTGRGGMIWLFVVLYILCTIRGYFYAVYNCIQHSCSPYSPYYL